jgi:hypothetical protein
MSNRQYLPIDVDSQRQLIAAARDPSPVKGLTHSYYKYPARFSPVFVRAAIEIFTEPGELVLDPHVGGGTTLVEALVSGRKGVGVDISTLAEFVAKVKCTIYSEEELKTLSAWARKLAIAIDLKKRSIPLGEYTELGYYKHLDHPSRWRLRKAIEQAIWSAIRLNNRRLEEFGRCAVLRAAQSALDGRYRNTSFSEFREALEETAEAMIVGAYELRDSVKRHGRTTVTILQRSAVGIENDRRLTGKTPKLIVTSPPYPGVHVLYHRWQVDGRKEAPLPFMIANKLDGAGLSYYTMGDRKNPGLKTYFKNITASMSSAAKVADADTTFVQMVAFSEPAWQLPRYVEAMQEAGLKEYFLSCLKREADGRLWRRVPGRRWYSEQRGDTAASREVVFLHKKT